MSLIKEDRTENNKLESSLFIIPLGGLGEVGRNMTVLRYQDDILVIDAGLGFPSEEHYGVDYILPDTSYLVENQELIKGIILTHGHEDHIGGLRDFLNSLDVMPPIYGTKLTLGLVEDKISTKKFLEKLSLRIVCPRHKIQLGCFTIEFIKVCHSIPDSVGLGITTPIGNIVHTGDFKLDVTPIDNQPTDLYKFAEYGEKGVLLLMSDSTNATKQGFTPSEREVAPSLTNFIGAAEGRVIVTTFASNVHRIQQILDIAARFNRKVALIGKSMERVTKKAINLGYINSKNTFIKVNEIDNINDNEVIILTTGSQGEPMSVLTRIANGEHKIRVKDNDTVIISAVAIPGNEKSVFNTINKLIDKSATVLYESYNCLHVSGHASSEELKLMMALIKPKYFMPIHGENRHLIQHAEIAELLNVNTTNIFVLNNGDILSLNPKKSEVVGSIPANKILIDGSGIGYVGKDILQDRQTLSKEGVVFVSVTVDEKFKVVSEPKITSKGFIIDGDFKKFYDDGSKYLYANLDEFLKDSKDTELDSSDIEEAIKEIVRDYSYSVTKRKPIVIPIVNQI